jgi:hypothetical protein
LPDSADVIKQFEKNYFEETNPTKFSVFFSAARLLIWETIAFVLLIAGGLALSLLNPLLIREMISLVDKKITTPDYYANLNLVIPYSVALAIVLGLGQVIQVLFENHANKLMYFLILTHRAMLKGAIFNHGFRIKLAAENVFHINLGL